MTDQLMLLNCSDREESRIAVVEGTRLEDYNVERSSRETLVGNLYLGRVEHVHPGLQAAFVNIGLERNAFLHFTEARYAPYDPNSTKLAPPHPGRSIEKIVRPGDPIIVQVTRDEFGDKGPSVTTHLAIAGKFLILTPVVKDIIMARRITNTRVKSMLQRLIEDYCGPEIHRVGPGFVCKTSAVSGQPRDVQADLEYLEKIWGAVREKCKKEKPPTLVYKEPSLVIRVVRDSYHSNIKEIHVDGTAVFQKLVDYFDAVMPQFRDRIKLYTEGVPIFHRYDIERQIEQLNQDDVMLPSGGRLVIEHTEALTAIDVNSGGLRESDPETLATRTNLEAAVEIMRQIRLRDLGGILVIDFIDMREPRNRRAVEDSLERESAKDRAQMTILPMSRFCLVQIARQKMRPSVQLISHEACPACGGTGVVKNTESMGLELLRTIKTHLENPNIAVIEARLHPDVVAFLQSKMEDVRTIEQKFGKKIYLFQVRELPINRAEFACYDHRGEKVVDFIK